MTHDYTKLNYGKVRLTVLEARGLGGLVQDGSGYYYYFAFLFILWKPRRDRMDGWLASCCGRSFFKTYISGKGRRQWTDLSSIYIITILLFVGFSL